MALNKELWWFAEQAGGSAKTRANRKDACARWARCLRGRGMHVSSIAKLRTEHLRMYAEDCRARGLSDRTMQSEFAAIRTTLRAADRMKLAANLTNRNLGIAGASRAGTKIAIPRSEYEARVARLDPAVRAGAELSYTLGLRGEEVVQCGRSLIDWERSLAEGKPAYVVFGTKGGRPRRVNPPDVDAARAAVAEALRLAGSHESGELIVGAEGSLRSAMNKWSNDMRRAGFEGKYSGHSCRYAFARDRVAAYEATGMSRANALAATACDLGHGSGRGRWVTQVYLR